jgi:hypothetical protein
MQVIYHNFNGTSPVDTIFLSVGGDNCRSAVSYVRTLSSKDNGYLFLNNRISLKGLCCNVLPHFDHELLDLVFEGGDHSSAVLRTIDVTSEAKHHGRLPLGKNAGEILSR